MADIKYTLKYSGPEIDEILTNSKNGLEQLDTAVKEAQDASAKASEDSKNATEQAQKAIDAAKEATGFRKFFSCILPDENGNIDPSRPMTTPSAQPSWTIESKGDRIQSVRVNGPGGMRMVAFQLDGTKNWTTSTTSTRGKSRWALSAADMGVSLNAPSTNNDVAQIFSSAFAAIAANGTFNLSAGIAVDISGNLRVYDPECDTSLSDWKAKLNDNPLLVWAVPAGESQATGLYIPIQARGHEYRCQCLPLTEALASGDNVQSNVPSGCDKAITLDGSAVQVSQSGSAYVATAENAVAGGSVYANGLANLSLLSGQVSIPSASFPDTVTSAQTANEWLQDNPQTVYYQSIAYTEQTDVPVELETHANGNVYAHPAVDLVAVPYTQADVDAANQLANTPSTLPYIEDSDVPMLLNESDETQTAESVAPIASALPVAGTYVVSSQEGTTVQVSLKAMQDGGDASTFGGKTVEELVALQSPKLNNVLTQNATIASDTYSFSSPISKGYVVSVNLQRESKGITSNTFLYTGPGQKVVVRCAPNDNTGVEMYSEITVNDSEIIFGNWYCGYEYQGALNQDLCTSLYVYSLSF